MHITIRPPMQVDKEIFLHAMQNSVALHHPWIKAPLTDEEFQQYLERYSSSTHKSYLVFSESSKLVGVFNVSEIVRGLFQNAYLGFYAIQDEEGKGYMSSALKLVLEDIFVNLKLHRIEANIQPENTRSIQLVRSNHFRKEGYSPKYLYIDGEWRDHERWAMTYEDWLA